MKRKFFALLIVLMTVSLVGIICLQGYLISDMYYRNETYFNQNAKKALATTSENLSNKEFISLFNAVDHSAKNIGDKESILQNICGQNSDAPNLDKTDLHAHIRSALDSVVNAIASDTTGYFSFQHNHKAHNLSSVVDYQYAFYQSIITEYANDLPIPKRLNIHHIKYFLDAELKKNELPLLYEFAVFKGNELTTIKTVGFDPNRANASSVFKTYLYQTDNQLQPLQLVVDFTKKQSFVLESITVIIVLSVILSLIILSTFFYAYKLLKSQRNISEIKTDFINNMTHELKTPIATINLALDFIKNPKVIEDANMRNTYLEMINQENKRIHAQVENVLRISKFENREMDMPKSRESVHELLSTSLLEMEEQTSQFNGIINTELSASKDYILANEKYFKTCIKNILDNSLKYCKNDPIINIKTENVKNCIILQVQDNGIGIHRKDKKNIFENFFRESTGNIHDVKGNGLGLAFVKQILDDHQAVISINSIKGKGTTVIIKLPLIS